MAAPLSWHFESLPSSQKNVWDTKLAGGMEGWVLYGGTGLALRLGHRESVDFDFFSSQRMEPLRFHAEMGFDGDILQAAPNTLSVMHAGVKLSFFGGLSLGVVASADSLDLCPIASLADLGACKLAALVNRVERKDYQDVAALLRHGLRLPHLLGCAEAVYHGAFPTAACLKSLTWFDDPVLARLSEEDRRLLEGAALAVEKIETVPLLSDRISPTTLGRQKN
ncbi:MAG: hypothetical protein EBS97_09010 [Verrucomicrobia bacterium]|nr:hypothetical protein [Verrucomicrobiota bacterium]